MSSTTRSLVLAVLVRGESLTIAEIMAITGENYDRVRAAVSRMLTDGLLQKAVRDLGIPGRQPYEYTLIEDLDAPHGTDAEVRAAADRFAQGVYDPSAVTHRRVPTAVARRSAADARRASLIAERAGVLDSMRGLQLAHERNSVPGYIVRLREMGERIRELDIRIDELGIVLKA